MKQVSKYRLITLTSCSLLVLAIGLPVHLHAEQYLYRYVNDEGIKELAHSIPPQYAQRGYEVLTLSGQLVKAVEAAPTAGDIAQAEAKRALHKQYIILKRRYSSVEDIEAAKRRRLTDLDTNIAILRGNINGTNTHIENLIGKAANIERSGKDVPAKVLNELSDAKAERAVVQELLETRLKEYHEVSKKYDADLATFVEGTAISKELSSKEPPLKPAQQ